MIVISSAFWADVERVYDVIIAVPYRLIYLRCTESAIHYIVRYYNAQTCFILGFNINHQILLDKLEHHGVRCNAHNLLTSYLFNRFQYTVNREERVSSGLPPILVGVPHWPQGSVLGPFFFLVYTNDLPNSCNSTRVLYADDSVLLCSDVSTEKLKSKCKNSFL